MVLLTGLEQALVTSAMKSKSSNTLLFTAASPVTLNQDLMWVGVMALGKM